MINRSTTAFLVAVASACTAATGEPAADVESHTAGLDAFHVQGVAPRAAAWHADPARLSVAPRFPFPSRKSDRPLGAFWYVTNDHGGDARDFVMLRYDSEVGAWTERGFGISPHARYTHESRLVYGIPIRANVSGEVVTCWRNAPDNPIGRPHANRDGCDNRCDYGPTCSCTIPRSGNHVQLLTPGGRLVLYAHLEPGSVPEAICPHEDPYVANANDRSGPNGHNPDAWVPESDRAYVEIGDFVGRVGHSGASGGPHLHIQSRTYDEGSEPLRFTDGHHQRPPTNGVTAPGWWPLGGTIVDEGDLVLPGRTGL